MRFLSRFLIVLSVLFLFQLSASAEVSYNFRVDDDNKVWVDVENDSDIDITVKSVVVSFYDEDGKLLEKTTLPCSSNCKVKVDGSQSFGPIKGPKEWDTVNVTKVYYD
jgi:hypothetical protein